MVATWRHGWRSLILGFMLLGFYLAAPGQQVDGGLKFAISFDETLSAAPLDGRVLFLISTNGESEPRFQITGRLVRRRFLALTSRA